MSRIPTTDDLIHFARSLQGTELTTVARRARFRVESTGDGLCYTPSVSGKPRKQTRDRLDTIVKHYKQTLSLSPSDYSKITHHSSYAIGVIAAC
jgi:hypothetical protein